MRCECPTPLPASLSPGPGPCRPGPGSVTRVPSASHGHRDTVKSHWPWRLSLPGLSLRARPLHRAARPVQVGPLDSRDSDPGGQWHWARRSEPSQDARNGAHICVLWRQPRACWVVGSRSSCHTMQWHALASDSRACDRESPAPAGRGLQPVDSDFSNPKSRLTSSLNCSSWAPYQMKRCVVQCTFLSPT